MSIIREYCPTLKTAIVRSNLYSDDFAHIAELRGELLSDFPDLTDDKIKVVYYAGLTSARTYGVEAHVPNAPKSYTRIKNTEHTF